MQCERKGGNLKPDMEKRLLKAIESRNTDRIEKAFEQVYNEYCRLVGYVISKYVAKRNDVEELVNDVFLKFSKEMFRVQFVNVKYYLVTCAKNAAVNFVKRNSGKEIIYLESVRSQDVATISDTAPFWELVNAMRAVLSEHEIEVVVQHAVYGYSFVELGKKYNCSVTTVNSTYHRALKKYKKEFEI